MPNPQKQERDYSNRRKIDLLKENKDIDEIIKRNMKIKLATAKVEKSKRYKSQKQVVTTSYLSGRHMPKKFIQQSENVKEKLVKRIEDEILKSESYQKSIKKRQIIDQMEG